MNSTHKLGSAPRLIYLLPFALLLGATPDRIPVKGPLPTCPRGSLLTVREGELRCQDLVSGLLRQVPNCAGFLAAPASQRSDEWQCTKKGEFDPQQVAGLSAAIERAKLVLADAVKVSVTPSTTPGLYVGSTALKTTGFIQRPGTEAGILSAHALCSDEFPDSHMCSGYELHVSVAHSIIRPSNRLPKSWTYHPSWKTPIGPAQNAEEGLADNCAGYTYEKADRGWSGIAAEYAMTAYNGLDLVLAFNGGPAAPCSSVLPIACCK